MKTFQEFQEQLSLSQAFARAGKPGIPSEKPTGGTTLDSLRRRTPSDLAKPRGSRAGIPITPLSQATYSGRIDAGRRPDPNVHDNPDYVGPTKGLGGSSGTRDNMPGTTPSNVYDSDKLKPKPKPISNPRPLPQSRTDRPKPLNTILRGSAPI